MQITQADHEAVTRAVAEAELTTSGEIVTVVASESDGYTDVALAFSALVAFTGLVLLAFFPDPVLSLFDALSGGWNSEWTPSGLFGLASGIGIALLGDPVYGTRSGAARTMLHASAITVAREGKPDIAATSPLPADFAALGFADG